jgi:hypothetical protein
MTLLYCGPEPTREEMSLQRDHIVRAIRTKQGTEFLLTSRECTEYFYATTCYLSCTGQLLGISASAIRAGVPNGKQTSQDEP